MHYKLLGKTGVSVSTLCFGTMSFGGDADESTSTALFNRCREAGINFFDCADAYAKGRSEEILGRLVASERDQLVITSKCFQPTGADANARGGNRRHIARAVEASLRRLGIDTIDLWYLHYPDPGVPIEETVGAMAELVASGDVKHLGVSNVTADELRRAHAVHPIAAVQNEYSLWTRAPERDVLPAARELGIGFVPSSLAGLGLSIFGGSLTRLYLRAPGTTREGSVAPSQQGVGLAKDSWMLAIGLALVLDSLFGCGRGRRRRRRKTS